MVTFAASSRDVFSCAGRVVNGRQACAGKGAGPTAPQVAGYRVEELVGFGGCGEVWRARDVLNGRLVALKVLRHDGPPAERDRLRREAAVLAGLRSPHIVRLLTVVTAARGLVLVLEFQGGGSLASLLRSRPRLAPGEVVTIAAPLAGALAEVHGAGIVHGDVSPANILFSVDGRPVLSDLGVARLVGSAGADAVTAAFADPAVLDGAPFTPASDVYALAAVCFEALAGRPPLAGATSRPCSPRRVWPASAGRPGSRRPAGCSPEAIEAALSPDVAARPDAATLRGGAARACDALAGTAGRRDRACREPPDLGGPPAARRRPRPDRPVAQPGRAARGEARRGQGVTPPAGGAAAVPMAVGRRDLGWRRVGPVRLRPGRPAGGLDGVGRVHTVRAAAAPAPADPAREPRRPERGSPASAPSSPRPARATGPTTIAPTATRSS